MSTNDYPNFSPGLTHVTWGSSKKMVEMMDPKSEYNITRPGTFFDRLAEDADLNFVYFGIEEKILRKRRK